MVNYFISIGSSQIWDFSLGYHPSYDQTFLLIFEFVGWHAETRAFLRRANPRTASLFCLRSHLDSDASVKLNGRPSNFSLTLTRLNPA